MGKSNTARNALQRRQYGELGPQRDPVDLELMPAPLALGYLALQTEREGLDSETQQAMEAGLELLYALTVYDEFELRLPGGHWQEVNPDTLQGIRENLTDLLEARGILERE